MSPSLLDLTTAGAVAGLLCAGIPALLFRVNLRRYLPTQRYSKPAARIRCGS